jgi:hypothetical protein
MKNEYEPTYWNSKGKFQEEYNFIKDKFIPSMGECKLMKAELVRCISRIYYDIYNNGGDNLENFNYYLEFVSEFVPKGVENNWFRTIKKIKRNTIDVMDDQLL